MSYIQSRGTGREKPISIVIDELASMYSSTGNMIADDINELINVVSRNYNIWLTIAHQEMFQFDEPTRKALMTLGTQMVGHTDDSDAAMFFAKRFDYIDPYDVKDVRKQFGSHTKQTFTKTRTIRGRDWGYDADHNRVYFDETHYDDDDEDNTETTHEVIDEWNTYHSPEEQLLTEVLLDPEDNKVNTRNRLRSAAERRGLEVKFYRVRDESLLRFELSANGGESPDKKK